MTIETDYLIIGGGACGLAFADEMLTRSDARMVIVDRRHAPGGHWNDAYNFVRLHQPSVFYGVESTDLADAQVETEGVNAGFLSLAEGSQIISYFHRLMAERLKPSGRVRYLPLHEMGEDGKVRSLLSGETVEIVVKKKLVDASLMTNEIPKTHTPKFEIASDAAVIPPNDLARLAPAHGDFVVLGAGKTGMDCITFLLSHGADPARIKWVVPRDPWLWNRATTQPGDDFFVPVFKSFVARQRALAEATSARDLFHRFEKAGIWMRLSEDVEPVICHGPTVSVRELEGFRSIGEIIRLGRVTAVEDGRLVLEQGERETAKGALHIDCTASALGPRPVEPVFQEGRIAIQMVRFPQIPFSAALIAFIEAHFAGENDAHKNTFVQPMALPDTIEDFVLAQAPDMMNRYHCAQDKDVRNWIASSRLDGYSRIAKAVPKDDLEKQAILRDLRDANIAAAANMERLTASVSAA